MSYELHMLEALETRRLLSASILVQDGTLIVRGTPRADEIVVSGLGPVPINAVDAVPPLLVTINGRQRSIDARKIHRVRVEAGAGDDQVIMTHTNSSLAVQDVQQFLPATLLGGEGNDTLVGGEAADSISGGAGNDLLDGAVGNDTVDGDGGNDTIEGNAGNDLLRGGNGHDRIVADDIGDSVQGGGGFDLLLSPHNNPATRSGLEANAAATLEGIPEFGYANGILTIFGTRKADSISLTNTFNSNPSSFEFQVNNRQVRGIAVSSIQKVVVLAGPGDDSIIEGPETINAGFTPEFQPFTVPMEVHGDEGNDTIIGGWGNDSLSGGEGDDEIAGALGDDAIDGGAGNDTLRGNDGADILRGRKGDDSLDGGDGGDHVNGGQGTDVVFGGAGIDFFESPTDSASEVKDADVTDFVEPAPGSTIN